MTMAPSALARDLEDLQERLLVAPPPRVARRVRALIHEALGLLTDTPARETSSHTVPVPLTTERGARYSPEPEILLPDEAAVAFAEARRLGRKRAGSVYETLGPLLTPGDVATRLGVTRATVHNWRQAGRLLALHPNRHTYVYPAFQFTEPNESDFPFSSTSPIARGSRPKIAFATSLRPAPTSPAKPTISPARISNDTF